VWVLTRFYGHGKSTVLRVIRSILQSAELAVEDRDAVWAALREFEYGTADLVDYLIGQQNHARGCQVTWTFDKRAASSRRFGLLDMS